MPAKPPGVMQSEFSSCAIHIPAVSSVELADLHQAVVQVSLGRGKSQMLAYRLCHCCKQDPVVGICALVIHLREPGYDLLLLCCRHFVEDTFTAHPQCHSNVGAFHNPLIQVTDVTPVCIRIGWVGTI